ncbi:hypothetical protein NE634_00740 [Lacrimispora saccharolytica]|nr:hypothetical protein [Lacrimispora saccharolytica]
MTFSKRIKNLNCYQKCFLLIMLLMSLVFTILYPITISRVGYEYKNSILVPTQENNNIIYSGKIHGTQAHFTVSEDKTLVFQYGDKTYGPYTLKEDPGAIPQNDDMSEYMTGVELRCGENILFRGGVLQTADSYWLYNEDGNDYEFSNMAEDETERDADGNIIDPDEPSTGNILELMNDPVLTHKGNWTAWLGALIISIFNAFSILYADEIFRWNLAFQIRDTDGAEPSDWEIAGRYVSWIILILVALIIYIMGMN